MMFIGWTSVASRTAAEQIAYEVVKQGHAACAQVVGPVTSYYRWEGALEKSEEFTITLKFISTQLAGLEKWLHAHHPYQTPEWIVVQADRVGEKYLSWAGADLQSPPFNS